MKRLPRKHWLLPTSLCLRGLAFTLALCMLWSFTLAGVAMAAHERVPEPPKPHSLWMSPAQKARMQAVAQKVKAMQAHAGRPGFPYRQAAAKAAQQAALHPQAAPHRSASITLLDSVGLLARPVPAAQVASWYAEKEAGHVAPARAALLSLWMGEWELAHNQHPQVAQPLFRQAQLLSRSTSAVYGVASYDAAMALFYEGAYADATASFRHLESRQSSLRGYDYNTCSLWLRHANACAAYHADRAAIGIPEPPRLDPLCGVAALAACLRSLGMPSGKQALLNASHVTGEGNNLDDIAAAAKKLGAAAYPVSAEDKAVIALPKPLVAYVEHDHFVALIRADKKGVSYLCADCGPWPGGRVDLTWAQWAQMNPGLYLAVTKPGSGWDQRLAAAQTGKPAPPVRVAMVTPTNQSSPHLLLHLGGLALPKGITVLNNQKGHWVVCGGRFYSPICVDYQCCLTQGGGGPGGGGPGGGGPGHGLGGIGGSVGPGGTATAMGPAADDPVNLATGNEEYTPTDLTVYNPHGPSVTWGRIYDSLQPYDLTTGSAYGVPEQSDFGSGWSQTYNLGVQDSFGDTTNNKYVYAANGSRTAFVAPAVPGASAPSVLCNVQPGAPFVVYWNYDSATTHTYFQIVNSDRSQWTTSEQAIGQNNVGNTNIFLLAKQTDRNGNSISFNYTTTDTGFPLLSTITNQDGTALLSILRVSDGTGNIAQIADCYGRSVFYHVEKTGSYGGTAEYAYALALDHVSQIVPTGAAVLPDRYVYGYQVIMNWEPSNSSYSGVHFPINYLHTITVPSPAGIGVSTATINYDPSYNGPLVTSLVDGNGNTTAFTSSDSSGNPSSGTSFTQVTFSAYGASTPSYAYVGGYDNSMNGTTVTDGSGQVASTATFSDPSNPFRPSSVADGNGNITRYVWDASGNMHQKTSPRGTITNYTWAFPAGQVPTVVNSVAATSTGFSLGELVQQQEGNKSPTTYAYFEPSGLTKTVTAPLPGTTAGTATTVTSFTYDNLGNIKTIITPGNNTANTITTTFGYSTPPAIGQALTITDNLQEVTTLSYDAQGNMTMVKDPLGNELDMTYTITNQLLTTSLPATGQTGTGHAGSQNTYLYAQSTANTTPQWPVAAALQYGPIRMTTVQDESSNPIRQIVNGYDYEGHQISISGSATPLSITYDALYRASVLTDGNNHSTSYFYNTAGYLAQVVYPGASATPPAAPLAVGTKDTISFTSYDNIGNSLSRTDGNNVTTTYTYKDVESLLTDITYPSGSIGNVHLTYDAYGRSSGMTDGTGNQTYAYDDNNALITKMVTWTGLAAKTVSYLYYPNTSVKSMTADSRSFAYSYDGAGRMSSLTNDNNETTSYGYQTNAQGQSNGWLQTKTLANGVVTSYTHDAQGRLLNLINKNSGGTTLSSFAIPATGGYDAEGNYLSVTASMPGAPATYSGTTNYAYDYGQSTNPQMNRSQLTGETSTRGGNYTNSFGYDGGTSTGSGNPTTFRGTANTFNADNQMTNTGYSYDGDGNPTIYKNATLTFDPENRMTANTVGGQTNSYSGDNLRAWKQSGGTRTYFLYDGEIPVVEETASGATAAYTASNTTGADGLVSRHTSSGSTFYTYDERGNVAQRLNSTGATTGSDLYDSYGARTGTTALADPFGYEAQSGYYTDTDTGLILCTYRFYDSQMGRFINRDPISYNGGVNLYEYAENNPADDSDSSGLAPKKPGPKPVKPHPPKPKPQPPVVCPVPPPRNCGLELGSAIALIGLGLTARLAAIGAASDAGIAICNLLDETVILAALCFATVYAIARRSNQQACAVAAALTAAAILNYHNCVAKGGTP